MMCCWAGFNAHQAGRQIGEELKDLAAADTLADHHSAITIDAVGRNTDFAISKPIVITSPMDGFPQVVRFDATTLWQPRCRRVGAVHSSKSVADLASAFKLKRSLPSGTLDDDHHRQRLGKPFLVRSAGSATSWRSRSIAARALMLDGELKGSPMSRCLMAHRVR